MMRGGDRLLSSAADALGLLAQGGSFWLPPAGSTTAEAVDRLFYFIFYVSAFFFVLIVTLMVVFVIIYRRRPEVMPGSAPSHSTPLELTWTIIPLILVLVIFYMGFTGYMNMRVPPENAYEIRVTGQKWVWAFQYPGGYIDNNLHVPVDRPVKLTLTSEDVIHSIWIPRFRVKMDAVPGRYTTTWFEAIEEGEFELLCTEYCGTGHSDMLAKVVVHPPGGFEKWLEDASNLLDRVGPVEAGEILYRRHGCASCHSIDGTAKIGPTFKDVYGESVVLRGGAAAKVDDNYIRESILDPAAKIVNEYPAVMPTYKGRLKDKEITAIIEYIKSLKHEPK